MRGGSSLSPATVPVLVYVFGPPDQAARGTCMYIIILVLSGHI